MDGQGHLLGKITAGLDVAVNKGGEPGGVPAHIPGRYGGKGRDRQRQRHHQEKEPFALFIAATFSILLKKFPEFPRKIIAI